MSSSTSHPSAASEHAANAVLPILGGVELMRASFVTHKFSRHFHARYAIGFIEYGAMQFNYLGAGHVAPQGQINLVEPGEPHDGSAAMEHGWRYRMFYLPPQAVLEASMRLMRTPHLPHFRTGVINDANLAQAVYLTHSVLSSTDYSLLEKETRLLWLLSQWVHRHAENKGTAQPAPSAPKAAHQIRDYIHAHLEQDVTLAELSRLTNLSSFHLVRVFQQTFGLAPHAYLVQTRIRQARDMLLQPVHISGRLADIAAATGFSDQAHLTRFFKRHIGTTPGRYRKNIQNFSTRS